MKLISLPCPRFFSVFAAIVLVSAIPHPLGAAVVLSTTAPDEDSVLLGSSAPAPSGSLAYSRSSTTDQYGGVAFELSQSVTVSAATFLLNGFGNGASGAEVSLSIIKFAGLPGVPSPNPTTDNIYPYTTEHTEVMTLPSLSTPDNGKYITFSFTTPINLSAGTYGVLVHFTTAAGQRSINFRASSGNNGMIVSFRTNDSYSGSSITGSTYYVQAAESYFALQGTAVPEPSVAWLAGAGLVVAGGVARKRRAGVPALGKE